MTQVMHDYTRVAQIPDAVFNGTEVLSKEYLVCNCAEAVAEHGVVEVVFDRSLMTRLMGHKGSHLLVVEDDDCRISSAPVAGISVFFTDQSDFPEEAEDLAETLSEYSPFSWWFYVIVHPAYKKTGAMRHLVEETLRIVKQEGCRHLVADYMIKPTVCAAGKRLLELLGFRPTGRLYGNGLKELGDDVYAILIREVGLPIPWKR